MKMKDCILPPVDNSLVHVPQKACDSEIINPEAATFFLNCRENKIDLSDIGDVDTSRAILRVDILGVVVTAHKPFVFEEGLFEEEVHRNPHRERKDLGC